MYDRGEMWCFGLRNPILIGIVRQLKLSCLLNFRDVQRIALCMGHASTSWMQMVSHSTGLYMMNSKD